MAFSVFNQITSRNAELYYLANIKKHLIFISPMISLSLHKRIENERNDKHTIS